MTRSIIKKADPTAKALHLLKKTRIIIASELSHHLGVNPSTAETLLSTLLAEGYIREVSRTTICSQCTLRRICNIKSGCKYLHEGVKVYTLTHKALSNTANMRDGGLVGVKRFIEEME